MANPKGNPATLRKYQPKWKHGQTTVIRVPVALVEQIMDYAHRLDNCNDSEPLLRLNREKLEAKAKELTKKSKLPANWQAFINYILEIAGDT
jgi:hypothetical protein